MLRVLPSYKNNFATLVVARQIPTWVVKRAKSRFDSFCNHNNKPQQVNFAYHTQTRSSIVVQSKGP